MVMNFISKSARIAQQKSLDHFDPMLGKADVVKESNPRLLHRVAWIGEDFNVLWPDGKSFGFSSIAVEYDLSIILMSNLLICWNADMNLKTIAVLNFACEYDIPILWVGDSVSIRRHWNVQNCVNIITSYELWRLVCQMIK